MVETGVGAFSTLFVPSGKSEKSEKSGTAIDGQEVVSVKFPLSYGKWSGTAFEHGAWE